MIWERAMSWENHSEVILMMIAAAVLAALFMLIRVTIATKSMEGGILATMAKALASVGFIMVAAIGIFNGVINVKAAVFVVLGLVMGLIGDIVLDLKYVYEGRSEEKIYLSSGMVSFAVGHIFYFVALLMLYSRTDYITGGVIGISVAIAVVLAAAIMLGGRFLLKFDFGKFFGISSTYAFMLMFMSVFSIALCIVSKSTFMLHFAIGMILFLLSDVVLTSMYFGGKSRDKALCIINHSLYYGAQICIAAFVCLM